MKQYNLSTEEITKVIMLYSKISTPEKRIFAQGYLNGLGAFPSLFESNSIEEISGLNDLSKQSK